MLWFGSWLAGTDGSEGAWFYSGRGGDVLSYDIPSSATGLRIRRWPNEGLDAEFADIMSLPQNGDVLVVEDLDFDTRQPFSSLPEYPD